MGASTKKKKKKKKKKKNKKHTITELVTHGEILLMVQKLLETNCTPGTTDERKIVNITINLKDIAILI
jgi:hypothetical protein